MATRRIWGRWSRPIAHAFLAWFGTSNGCSWLDVGCGTGALSRSVLDSRGPVAVHGVDVSPDFVHSASENIPDPRARFEIGNAQSLPIPDSAFDAVVSGLVLNFVPNTSATASEMVRVASASGVIGGYVWDYSGEMQLVRFFWEAVAAIGAEGETGSETAFSDL